MSERRDIREVGAAGVPAAAPGGGRPWDPFGYADAPTSAMQVTPAGGTVAFFKLAKKFVDAEASVPTEATDVLYYTLSVGHHTGVIDCFERALDLPVAAYERIVGLLPAGEARRKLEGVLVFGEIEIDKSHVGLLLPTLRRALGNVDVFNEPGVTSMPLCPADLERLETMIDLVLKVRDQEALYLMVRRVA